MNTVNLIGRLAADLELRYTPKGTAVSNVNVAVDDGFGDDKKTLWIGVVIWGQQAENCAKYLVKGQKVGVTGRLNQEKFTPKGSDKPVRKTIVTASHVEFLDKPQGAGESRPARSAPAQQSTGKHAETGDLGEGDDIPF